MSDPSTQELSSICLSPSCMTNETISRLQRIRQKTFNSLRGSYKALVTMHIAEQKERVYFENTV